MSHVRKFHEAFGLPAPDAPTIPDASLAALRLRLIDEEMKEARVEFETFLRLLRAGRSPHDAEVIDTLQKLVKEVCDLRYVAEGALVSFGVEPTAYEEVHRSNMSKLGPDGRPVYRADGKVLKGDGYTPADPEKMFPSAVDGTYNEEE